MNMKPGGRFPFWNAAENVSSSKLNLFKVQSKQKLLQLLSVIESNLGQEKYYIWNVYIKSNSVNKLSTFIDSWNHLIISILVA